MTTRLLATLFLAALVTGCGDSAPDTLPGYAEGEYVRVASPAAGRLVDLRVQRGAQARAGDPLYALESENEAAQRREAADRLTQAQARLADLHKGRRPGRNRRRAGAGCASRRRAGTRAQRIAPRRKTRC